MTNFHGIIARLTAGTLALRGRRLRRLRPRQADGGRPGSDHRWQATPLRTDGRHIQLDPRGAVREARRLEGGHGRHQARTNFDQDVGLKFVDLPAGVTMNPASPALKHGDSDAKVTLKATDEAAPGEYTVKVMGHPTKGGDATTEFKLTVAPKDTFTLSSPFLSPSLKQGETKSLAISIKRDKAFDQDVTLSFADLPAGVTVEPASSSIQERRRGREV